MSLLSTGLKKAEKYISSKIPHVHESEKRASMQAAKEQIDYYRAAKNELGAERAANEAEKQSERAKINEKQIRARKATYRHAGFMETPSTVPQEKLG